jgi:hypothetical protein
MAPEHAQIACESFSRELVRFPLHAIFDNIVSDYSSGRKAKRSSGFGKNINEL